MLKTVLLCASIAAVSCFAEWQNLLDKDLSKFEIWMGIPHASVTGLPDGTYQSDNVHEGTPLGLNNDVKKVFSVTDEGGETVLKITGEIYGGLTTLDEFENYHLQLQVKWGDKKWEPRLNDKRDSGIIYHCRGEHGAFWNTWKAGLEFQVQESDMGDFIPLAGPSADIRGKMDGKTPKYDPVSETYIPGKGYIHCTLEPDLPRGEWNTLDLYVIGNTGIHVVNGQVVMVVENARDGKGAPLTRGQIQIQSEAAECSYKNILLCPITEFPPEIAAQIRLR